jgi:ABC-2 type transport system ATP-binding protein
MQRSDSRLGRSDALTVDRGSPSAPVIAVSGVSKWYGDVVAVSDVTFNVDPGVTALLGPNGAGKSTLFRMLSGLIKPSTGSVRVLGRPVRGDAELYRHLALVPEQDSVFPFLTGREFVRLNAILHGLADPDAATERSLVAVGLLAEADRSLSGYSKGMRQRAKCAAALVHRPEVVILDEPLNGIDPYNRVRLIELIRELGESGCAVVVCSHVLHEVERFADRILVIVNGKLAAAGDFRTIREKLDDHAHAIRVRADEPRRLAAAILRLSSTRAVRLDETGRTVIIETADVRDFYQQIPRLASSEGIRLYEIAALDDSLASVVAYITER